MKTENKQKTEAAREPAKTEDYNELWKKFETGYTDLYSIITQRARAFSVIDDEVDDDLLISNLDEETLLAVENLIMLNTMQKAALWERMDKLKTKSEVAAK